MVSTCLGCRYGPSKQALTPGESARRILSGAERTRRDRGSALIPGERTPTLPHARLIGREWGAGGWDPRQTHPENEKMASKEEARGIR